MSVTDDFARVSCSTIRVDRAKRQRTKIDTTDLESSIRLRGVLHPIIVDRDYLLIAGERRLTASIRVGLPDIPIRFVDEISPDERMAIELEENIKRTSLHWRDEVRAYGKIHAYYATTLSDWTEEKTGKEIGVSQTVISQMLTIFSEIDNPKIAQCTGVTEAFNVLKRHTERRLGDVMNKIMDAGSTILDPAIPPPAKGIIPSHQIRPAPKPPTQFPESIFNVDFLKWVEQYSGPKFNFVHCDFPYGINVFAAEQSGKNRQSTYDDDPELYWRLIESFCGNRDRFISHSAHIMFWFSMDHYHATLELFKALAPDLHFQRHPLYWTKTDNVGILPDPRRGPRRIVETCFIASRGDRPIVKATSNWYGCPTDKTYHTSTKPEPMLRVFMQMFIDEQTVMFDPTCGSGSSLRAAESLGAKRVLGLEADSEHCAAAQSALKQFRLKRAGNKVVESVK